MANIVVVGSLAYDSIKTPRGEVQKTLGGSSNYFSLAASNFAGVKVVGVVGDDYNEDDLKMLSDRSIDISGIERVAGETFHWKGEYKGDMNEAITLATDLNVFESFNPRLPESYRDSEYVFLANIDPVLQLSVLEQVKSPRLVFCDTMNFWIDSKLPELKKVLSKVDVLLINEGEADQLAGEQNAIASAKKIVEMGPKAVVIKRGEYGFVLYCDQQYFILPAFPIADVIDPTGAGDTFAGGFIGSMAKAEAGLDLPQLKQACVYGCLMASFTVQGFGVEPQKNLNWTEVETRMGQYRQVLSF